MVTLLVAVKGLTGQAGGGRSWLLLLPVVAYTGSIRSSSGRAILRDQVAGIDTKGYGKFAEPLQGRTFPAGHDLPEMTPADARAVRQMGDRDLAPLCPLPDVPDHPAMQLVHGRHAER